MKKQSKTKNSDFDPIESKRNRKPKQDNKYDPARKNKNYFIQNAMDNSNDNC